MPSIPKRERRDVDAIYEPGLQADRIRPIANYALFELIPEVDKTPSGIHLPENRQARQHTQRAKVRALGPGRRLDNGEHVPVDYAVGDKVLLPDYRGAGDLTLDGKKYLLVSADLPLAVLVEE